MNRFLFCSIVAWCMSGTMAAAESPVSLEARAFRIYIYNQYRHDRETYNRLREVEEELSKQWGNAGRPEAHAPQIAQWFVDARRNLQAGNTIPQTPDLTPLVAAYHAEKQQAREAKFAKRTSVKKEMTVSAESPKNSVKTVITAQTETKVTSTPVTTPESQSAALNVTVPGAESVSPSTIAAQPSNQISKSIVRALWRAWVTQ
jgi:hypothetical protein